MDPRVCEIADGTNSLSICIPACAFMSALLTILQAQRCGSQNANSHVDDPSFAEECHIHLDDQQPSHGT